MGNRQGNQDLQEVCGISSQYDIGEFDKHVDVWSLRENPAWRGPWDEVTVLLITSLFNFAWWTWLVDISGVLLLIHHDFLNSDWVLFVYGWLPSLGAPTEKDGVWTVPWIRNGWELMSARTSEASQSWHDWLVVWNMFFHILGINHQPDNVDQYLMWTTQQWWVLLVVLSNRIIWGTPGANFRSSHGHSLLSKSMRSQW